MGPSDYELLDFGEGRKLERFGEVMLDRPSPAAMGGAKRRPELWRQAHACFDQRDDQSAWMARRSMPERWTVRHGGFVFELKLSPQGQVGLFPEHAAHWSWISGQTAGANRSLATLNLFAYTGGATLAAAGAASRVAHVDAARSLVGWARRNAELSGLAEASIRWIVEDASSFVRRERRRGRRYDAVILDPPSYGHGPKGQAWKLNRHLPALLAGCAALTGERPAFALLTCHTPGFGPERLRTMLAEAFLGGNKGNVWGGALTLETADGRRLPCGAMARWPS